MTNSVKEEADKSYSVAKEELVRLETRKKDTTRLALKDEER
jgi:hypothetical protein